MTLLDRILARGLEVPMDPILAARLDRHTRRIRPDPLFRRRLRGQILNRYVAAREGLLPVESFQPGRAGRRQMGALGRSVLYASLLTAMSVTAVGAASQESLPGDALYGVKLQLEDLRMRLAPTSLRDDLAAMSLDERLEEVELLAESGRWSLVEDAAARAEQAEQQLLELTAVSGADEALREASFKIERHAARLAELMTTAPASARPGLERALEASSAAGPPGPAEPAAPPAGQDRPPTTGSGQQPADPATLPPTQGNGETDSPAGSPPEGAPDDGNGSQHQPPGDSGTTQSSQQSASH